MMRAWGVILILILAPIARAETKLALELKGGMIVVGQPAKASFELETPFGVLTVPMKHVHGFSRSAEDGKITVRMSGQDRYSGVLKRDTFMMSTSVGDVTVPVSHVREGRVFSGGQPVSFRPWSKAVDGLQIRAWANRSVVKSGETFRVTMELRNVGKQSLLLPTLRAGDSVRQAVYGGALQHSESFCLISARADGAEEGLVALAQEMAIAAEAEELVLASGQMHRVEVDVRVVADAPSDAVGDVDPKKGAVLGPVIWAASAAEWRLMVVFQRPRMGGDMALISAQNQLFWNDEVEAPDILIKVQK